MKKATAIVSAGLVIAAIATVLALFTDALTGSATTESSREPAPTATCKPSYTEELYVQAKYVCPDPARVYTFASNEARDKWVEIATELGVVVIDQDDKWVKVRG